MDQTQIERAMTGIVAFYQQRGIITLKELVHDLLLTLARVEPPSDVPGLFRLLPRDVKLAILERLAELRDVDFRWRPFMIGPGFDDEALEKLRIQLRRIDLELSPQPES